MSNKASFFSGIAVMLVVGGLYHWHIVAGMQEQQQLAVSRAEYAVGSRLTAERFCPNFQLGCAVIVEVTTTHDIFGEKFDPPIEEYYQLNAGGSSSRLDETSRLVTRAKLPPLCVGVSEQGSVSYNCRYIRQENPLYQAIRDKIF